MPKGGNNVKEKILELVKDYYKENHQKKEYQG